MAAKNFKQFDSDPWWTTQVRKRYGDLLVGIDQNVWMYRRVANGPVEDAVNGTKMLQVGESIDEAIAEVATLTGKTRTKRRSIDKSAYRHCHLLAINVPRMFIPPDIENRDYLSRLYPDRQLRKRVVLFGVRLKATTGGTGGFQATMASIRHTLLEGGTPMSDYDKDRLALDAALTRAGLHMPAPEDLKLANSWWNNGNHADIPYMPHGDHMHLFNSEAAARSAKRLHESTDYDSCAEWPNLAGEHSLSFSTIESFEMDYMRATDPRAHWGSSLLNSGAVAVSVRFMVEPSAITREELRRMKKNYRDDIAERYANGKMERAEQEEMLGRLTDVEAHYSGQGYAPPTLTDTSVTVAVSGRHERNGFDPTEMGDAAGTSMDSMLNRQEQAFIDMMMCSNVRSNPHLHDLPSAALAYSGLPDLSVAGDAPRQRGAVALLGFSERDRQPMWMDAMAATDEDSVPICLVVGQSGSGKSVLMQWMADQYARTTNDRGEKTPVIMLDLKESSNFSTSVALTDGHSFTLSDLINDTASDGVFDAIRFSITPQAGIDRAHTLIMQVNPFGGNRLDYETPLRQALSYGVDNGAVCTGQALEMAAAANGGRGVNAEVHDILTRVKAAATSPIFRAICGFNPNSPGLRVSGGITYIRIGDMSLDLPSPGSTPDEQTQMQRTWLALVKAMVYGSISALANRQGVVLFDEGWIFLGSGRAEMEAMGRLARSQQVFPIIFTQRTQDALKAELEGYISRGVILPIEDQKEAAAALKLFNLEATPERMTRITGKATRGDAGADRGAPNWNSFRALRDPRTKKVVRGTIGLYVDLAGNAVPTEIALSPTFLLEASTNREDMAKREAETKARAEAESEARQAAVGW